MWFAAFEEYAVFILIAGLLLAAIGWIALLAHAFRWSKIWGVGILLLPPLGLLYMLFNFKSVSVRQPALVILFGLVVAASPIIVSRLASYFIDLGPWEKQVNGELHLTLTGWDRKDYSILQAKPTAVVLQVANPDVTDETIDFILPMTGLRELDLNDTKLTDMGLAKLKALAKLEALRLRGAKITDGAFKDLLPALPNLKELDVRGTPVSAETIKEWRAAGAGRRANYDRPPPPVDKPSVPASSVPVPSEPVPSKSAA